MTAIHEKIEAARQRRAAALAAIKDDPRRADLAEQTDILIQSSLDERAAIQEATTHSPQMARSVASSYMGPAMPDKGKRDGSCNRSACQMPLAGNPQYVIRSTGDHYCQDCARKFNNHDAEMRRELRCELV